MTHVLLLQIRHVTPEVETSETKAYNAQNRGAQYYTKQLVASVTREEARPW